MYGATERSSQPSCRSDAADQRDLATAEPSRGPRRLIDREQLAHLLGVKLVDVRTVIRQPGFPRPIAYFRGRLLWEEAAVERWASRPRSSGAGSTW
jgi:predicted DNA-binding transcriptional regulator AlpA